MELLAAGFDEAAEELIDLEGASADLHRRVLTRAIRGSDRPPADVERALSLVEDHLAAPFVSMRPDTTGADRTKARWVAQRFAEILNASGIRAKAWLPGRPSEPPRVYLGEQYVTAGRGGIDASSRGKYTFVESHLYPRQRQAYRRAVAQLLDELDATF